MKTSSHVMIGHFLADYVKEHYGVILDRESFARGNILPDRRMSFLTRPHFLKYNSAYVQRKILGLVNVNLSDQFIDRYYSKHLGIICHYYADFFCYAHSPHFQGNLAAHRGYEETLHRFLTENISAIGQMDFMPVVKGGPDIDKERIYEKFDEHHAAYAASVPSYEIDITCCLRACVEAIVMITNASFAETAKEKMYHSYAVPAV